MLISMLSEEKTIKTFFPSIHLEIYEQQHRKLVGLL